VRIETQVDVKLLERNETCGKEYYKNKKRFTKTGEEKKCPKEYIYGNKSWDLI
jgi:hypothetical protein